MSLDRDRRRGARFALRWLLALCALATACVAAADTRTTTTTTTTTITSDEAGAEGEIPTTGVPVIIMVGNPNEMEFQGATQLTIAIDGSAPSTGQWIETEVTGGASLLEQAPGYQWVPPGKVSIDVPLIADDTNTTTGGDVTIRARRAGSTSSSDWVTDTIGVGQPPMTATMTVRSATVIPDSISLDRGTTLWLVLSARAPAAGQPITLSYSDASLLENPPLRALVPAGERFIKIPVNAKRNGTVKGTVVISAGVFGQTTPATETLYII